MLLSDDFIATLVSGSDERSALDAQGWNRYFLPSRQAGPLFCRGSCTCGFLTIDAMPAAVRLFEAVRTGAQTPEATRERQRGRLRDHFGLDERHDIVFAPSGTDLCYLPLLLSQVLWPDDEVTSAVTCAGELGSGSTDAHRGRYFGNRTQLGAVRAGEPLEGVRPPTVHTAPARSIGGAVSDPGPMVRAVLRAPGRHIVQVVESSKSGIHDDAGLLDEALAAGALVCVDLCQLRGPLGRVRALVDRGALVMVTGSKFFQAPPFCAALVVPAELGDVLAAAEAPQLRGFERLFARDDLPTRWKGLREALPDVANLGLMLRWEAALDEMDRYSRLDPAVVDRTIAAWRSHVLDQLERRGDHFVLVPSQGVIEPSIVSFYCRGAEGTLGFSALRQLYERIVSAPQSVPGFDRSFIGQPVEHEGGAFLRLALGANDIQKLLDGSERLEHDTVLIEAIADEIERSR